VIFTFYVSINNCHQNTEIMLEMKEP